MMYKPNGKTVKQQYPEWTDDTPERPDNSTVSTIDIRHTDTHDYLVLDEYSYLSVCATIRHVYSFPHRKKFMASITAIGSGCNGKAHYSYEDAKNELDQFVDDFVKRMQSYE